MVKDDQKGAGQAALGAPALASRSSSFRLTALVLTVVSLASATGFWAASWLRKPDPVPQGRTVRGYRDWPKPDLAIVLSGEMHGYLQPCGCSEPQKGGLARRYNLIQSILKDRGWPVVAADLGDVAQANGPQALLKYRYAMEGLQKLHYTAIGLGANETTLPLLSALGEFALNNPSPRVLAANLHNMDKDYPGMVKSMETSAGEDGVPKVTFVSVIGPSVAKQMQENDRSLQFDPVEKTLEALLPEIQKTKAQVRVLLYEGSEEEAKAYAVAAQNSPQKLPEFQIVVWLSGDLEPSEKPGQVGNSLLLSVGHKGQYVGIVGYYGQGSPFRYDLVPLNPEFETPEGHDQDNPLHALMQKYAKEVRDDNYLAKYPHNAKHPVQIAYPAATYVGSEKCKKCHDNAYDVWKNSAHSHAYAALTEKAKRPTLRQFDGECLRCHVTGFGQEGGFVSEEKTPLLKNVGCESCHGPASLHVKNPNDASIRAALNPLKAKIGDKPASRLNRMHDSCQTCHDLDNSVHFNVEKYWEKIIHTTPKE